MKGIQVLFPPALSTEHPCSLGPPLLTEIRTSVSFINRRRLSSHCFTSFSYRVTSFPVLSHISQPSKSSAPSNNHWIVIMKNPPIAGSTKPEIVDYYVETLARVVGSVRDAQTCIYDASWESCFRFCCNINEELSHELACVPGVLSVKPDNSLEAGKRDHSRLNFFLNNRLKSDFCDLKFSSYGKDYEYWFVQTKKPGVEIVTKRQLVDYYARMLTKVLRNEKDAQVSMYYISWKNGFGFCCQINEECAKELSEVPGVLSVRPDLIFGSESKIAKPTGGNGSLQSSGTHDSLKASFPNVKTKRLFVTGISFYTSERTLRAAFEGFGGLIEVTVVMDKISRRSKGYAFIEYTTEEAAGVALREMNGKIINGWTITVDVARTDTADSFREKQRKNISIASSN